MKRLHMLAALATAMLAQPAWSDHLHVSFPELVHTSHVIVDGRVEHVEVFEDANGLPVTDVTVSVIDTWHADAVSQPFLDDTITWTIPGGTIGDRSMDAGSAHFEPGERVVIFALLDGYSYLNPFIGGEQGVFRVREAGEVELPMSGLDRGILGISGNEIQWSPIVDIIQGDHAVFLPPPHRGEEPKAHGEGVSVQQQQVPVHGRLMNLDAFRGMVIGEARKPAGRHDLANRLVDMPDGEIPAGEVATEPATSPAVPRPVSTGQDEESANEARNDRGDEVLPLCWCGSHELNIVMEMMPESSWVHAYDSAAMIDWNRFMDIFRVVPDDGSYGVNDENEFCGFLETIPDAYGSYEWGPSHLGVCFNQRYWPGGCDSEIIAESDIMFNANMTWTTDFDEAFGSDDVILYQPVVSHELGHAWGFVTGSCAESYNYTDPTIMGAYLAEYCVEDSSLHTGDAEVIRLNYLDQTSLLQVLDVGCESYRAWGSLPYVNATTAQDEYLPGDSVTIGGATVENMSTNVTYGVRVRYYLSTDRTITTSDYQLPGYIYWELMDSFYWWAGHFTSTIPNVPPGEYWVGMIVTTGGDSYNEDAFDWNNATWLIEQVTILPPPPSNDDCEDAIATGPGDHAFNTAGSTSDGYTDLPCGDGDVHGDIWYRYQAEGDGVLIAHVCNSASFDTMLAVYEDPGVCPPGVSSLLGCNDDNDGWGCGQTSLVGVDVLEGQDYLVRLGGASQGVTGSGTLSLIFLPTPPPLNDDCEDAQVIVDGDHPFDTSTATTDGYAHMDSCSSGDQAHNDVWFSYTATWAGELNVSTCDQADFDTMIAVYHDTGACPPGINDLVICNDDATGCSNFTSDLTLQVAQGDQLLVRVGGYWDDEVGTGTLSIELVGAPPPNDQCSESITLFEGDHSFDTTHATTDGFSHQGVCEIEGLVHNDIWYSYTSPCNGTLTLSTCSQADFDTDIVVYDATAGCTPGDTEVLACNDAGPGCDNYTSLLEMPVTSGQHLLVRVGGFSPIDAGQGTLTVDLSSEVANDACADAIPIQDGEYEFETLCATTDGASHTDSCDINDQAYNDIWFSYTTQCPGILTLSTCDQADFDTDIVVYDASGGCTPGEDELLACNDSGPGCSGYTSRIEMPVTNGQQLLVRVGGFSVDDFGSGTLTVSLEVAVPHDDCVDALLVSDGQHEFDTTCATTDGLVHETCQWDGQTWNDVWFRYVATCDGELLASTCNLADYDTDLAVYADSGSCPPGDADLLGCNDDGDGCAGYTSFVIVPVTQGETYLVRVGGWSDGDVGPGALLLSCDLSCPSDVAPLGNPDGVVDVLDLLAIIEMWGTGAGPADINADGIVDVLDLLKVIEAWGVCD